MVTSAEKILQPVHLPGLVYRDHNFDVPLDYSKPDAGKIRIFAREAVAPAHQHRTDLPWLVWFSGGPGFQAPRPESDSGWLRRALKEYRVLLLDQRGTGLSTPVTHESLDDIGDAHAQSEYLKHFRADNIVRDAEFIRDRLADGKRWSILGQSFGGFCCTTYLSQAPDGLEEAIITGGIPPLIEHADEAYRGTYRQVIKKNREYYSRFPADAQIIQDIVDHLRTHEVFLPNGDRMSVNRFLQLGFNFGFTDPGASMTTVHYLLERAFLDDSRKKLSYYFLRHVEKMLDFNTNPIYAILHEAIYCEGTASKWSAERVLHEFPEFGAKQHPLFFTGEMVYPWMFDHYEYLKPLKEAAAILSEFDRWPSLYDISVLKQNRVKTVAAIYLNDMYVDFDLSQKMATNIDRIRLWITNEYEHDAIRVDGERVLDRLLSMLHGER